MGCVDVGMWVSGCGHVGMWVSGCGHVGMWVSGCGHVGEGVWAWVRGMGMWVTGYRHREHAFAERPQSVLRMLATLERVFGRGGSRIRNDVAGSERPRVNKCRP